MLSRLPAALSDLSALDVFACIKYAAKNKTQKTNP